MFLINPYIFQASGDPLWNDLLAYYTADNTPNDSLGNYNLTAVNGANYGTGIINQGFNFDGVNDYYNGGNVLDFDGNTPFSFNLWVNPTSISNDMLFWKMNPLLTTSGYICYIYTGNLLEFALQNSSSNRIYAKTSTAISGSVFSMITITYDGSKDVSGVKIYINGVSDTLTTIDNTLTGSTSNTENLSFGRGESSVNYFGGIMDEVGIWNKELTASEVTELYNSGSGLQY